MSYVMGALVRRANALELVVNIHVLYAFTNSTHNPADMPSRRFVINKKKQERPPLCVAKMMPVLTTPGRPPKLVHRA